MNNKSLGYESRMKMWEQDVREFAATYNIPMETAVKIIYFDQVISGYGRGGEKKGWRGLLEWSEGQEFANEFLNKK